MFRDDLKAAQARTSQLERELAEMKTNAERAERQVASLREINADQERELERLRKRLGEKAPAKAGRRIPPQVTLAVVMVVLGAAAALFFIWNDLDESRGRPPAPSPATKVAPPAAQAPVGAEATSFTDFVRNVGARCSISRAGFLSSCKPKGLRDDLRRAEERVGSQAAMLAYCQLLSDESEGGAFARLAAYRMRGFYGKRLESVDRKVYSCLDRFVRSPASKEGATFGNVVHAWAKLGAQQGETDKVLEGLATMPSKARAKGYQGLWRVAKLKVLPQLEEVLLGDDAQLVEGTIEAFGYLKKGKERELVCPLLVKALAKHQASRTRSRIAYRAALSCKDAVNGPVLAAARVAIDAPEPLDFWWVAAVRHCARRPATGATAKMRTSSSLLQRVVEDKRRTPSRRAQALRALAVNDRARAMAMARRYVKEGPRALGRAAKRLLE